MSAGYTVKNELSINGKVEEKMISIGSFEINPAGIASVSIDVYLKIDFNGKISLITETNNTINIKKNFNGKTNSTAKHTEKNSGEINCELQVLAGLDAVVYIVHQPIIDLYINGGIAVKAKWDNNNPLYMKVDVYFPVLTLGIGENEDTLLSWMFGIKAKFKIIDIENGMWKSPLIYTKDIKLFDYNTEKESISEQNTIIENITTEKVTNKQTSSKQEESTTLQEQTTTSVVSNTKDETTTQNSSSLQEETTLQQENEKSVKWKIEENTLVIYGEGEMENYDSFNNIVPWNNLLTNIEHVRIEDGVTSIGKWAFENCDNLKSVTMADSVVNIKDYAFMGCEGLTNVSLSKNLKVIGNYAFNYCMNLTEIEIPLSVTDIKDAAFMGCSNLIEVYVPQNVQNIGKFSFAYCNNLELIKIPKSANVNSYAFSVSLKAKKEYY